MLLKILMNHCSNIVDLIYLFPFAISSLDNLRVSDVVVNFSTLLDCRSPINYSPTLARILRLKFPFGKSTVSKNFSSKFLPFT